MKKTALMILVAIFATTTMTAQDNDQREFRGPDPAKFIEKQVKHMDKKLQLTDEQKEQLKEFYGEFGKAQQARMEQMRQMEKRDREALNGKIKSILTDEQKAKYDEMKEKEKEMWKEGHGDFNKGGFGKGRGHGRPGRMGHGGHRGFGGNGDFGTQMSD